MTDETGHAFSERSSTMHVIATDDCGDRTTPCAACGRLGTDGAVQWHRPTGPEPRLYYCRHCWSTAYARHRAEYQAQVDARIARAQAWTLGRGPAPTNSGRGLSASSRWIAGSGWLPRLARRIFP
jgi:hypothetical protein